MINIWLGGHCFVSALTGPSASFSRSGPKRPTPTNCGLANQPHNPAQHFFAPILCRREKNIRSQAVRGGPRRTVSGPKGSEGSRPEVGAGFACLLGEFTRVYPSLRESPLNFDSPSRLPFELTAALKPSVMPPTPATAPENRVSPCAPLHPDRRKNPCQECVPSGPRQKAGKRLCSIFVSAAFPCHG